MSEGMHEPDFATDGDEMKIRERFVILEERIGVVFWLAVAAELGVLGLAAILILHSLRGKP